MKKLTRTFLLLIASSVGLAFAAPTAEAHFPWLDKAADGKVVLFFGEDLTDRTYHLPESLQAFPLQHHHDGQVTDLELVAVDTDAMVGLQSADPAAADGLVYGEKVYGDFRGSTLVYYVQHFLGADPQAWSKLSAGGEGLQVSLAPAESGLAATVLWHGKPLPAVDVKLFCADGHEEASKTTNAEGVVAFAKDDLEGGLNALMVGLTEPASETPKRAASINYLTATFYWEAESAAGAAEKADATKKVVAMKKKADSPIADSGVAVVASGLPEMPAELTSFGAAIAGRTIFLYGGHTGSAHSYSTAEQSNQLWGLNLDKPAAWQVVSTDERLQGLALVPAGANSLLRVGGFTALNAEGEEHRLQSQDEVKRYDADKNEWTVLPSLPEPRSSTAAAVIGNEVYVVGGWELSEGKPNWLKTAWKLDFAAADPKWVAIAAPGFQRRAIAVAAHQGQIYVIGGMTNEDGPSTATNVYDPQSNTWSEGPSLVGDSMTGFGCAAYAVGGRLYVSTVSGNVQRLSVDGKKWEIVTEYDPGRFFHAMLPDSDSSLLMIGGANMSVGKFTELDRVTIADSE